MRSSNIGETQFIHFFKSLKKCTYYNIVLNITMKYCAFIPCSGIINYILLKYNSVFLKKFAPDFHYLWKIVIVFVLKINFAAFASFVDHAKLDQVTCWNYFRYTPFSLTWNFSFRSHLIEVRTSCMFLAWCTLVH